MTLNEIRQTTTLEHLGTEATQADVDSYLELLAVNWPTDNADEWVDDDMAHTLKESTFDRWCRGARA